MSTKTYQCIGVGCYRMAAPGSDYCIRCEARRSAEVERHPYDHEFGVLGTEPEPGRPPEAGRSPYRGECRIPGCRVAPMVGSPLCQQHLREAEQIAQMSEREYRRWLPWKILLLVGVLAVLARWVWWA